MDMDTSNNCNDGSDILLNNKFTLWSHDIHNKNWSINGYKNICTFGDVSSFWKILNNFNKYGVKFNHFFVMKENIHPIWEHPINRNGGVCSLRVDLNSFESIWEDLNINMVCGKLTDNSDDINGLSISPKNNWAIIKIWNKDSNNDLSMCLSKNLLDKYSKYSIRYKPNSPEY